MALVEPGWHVRAGWLLALVATLTCHDEGEYDPCAGLECGDVCTLCDPANPECAETDIVKFCDADLVCDQQPVTCPRID